MTFAPSISPVIVFLRLSSRNYLSFPGETHYESLGLKSQSRPQQFREVFPVHIQQASGDSNPQMKRPSVIALALLSKCLYTHSLSKSYSIQSVPNTPTSNFCQR